MKVLYAVGLFALLLFFGCASQPTKPVDQSVVPNKSDVLKTPTQENQTIRGLTGDKCGSYTTYNGLSESDYEKLQDCYMQKYLDRAVETSDIKICDEIYHPYEYGNCYGLLASKLNDSSLCNQVVNIKFERRTSSEDATTFEVCKLTYVDVLVNSRRQVPDINCNDFSSEDYKRTCNEYLGTIKPAAGIKTLYVNDEATRLEMYIILEDAQGETQTEDGELTVTVNSEAGKELWKKTYNVSKGNFRLAILGTGAFEHQDIIYELPDIALKELTLDEDECASLCTLVVNVEFKTKDGRVFKQTEEQIVDAEQVSIRKLSDCLSINNLKDELIDESSQYYTRKYLQISGTVTNNCGSTKDFIKVRYLLFNKQNVVLLDGFTYLDPSTLPAGYSTDFEIKLQYEGGYKDVIELPDHYNVTIEG